jgi:hypothetical protein
MVIYETVTTCTEVWLSGRCAQHIYSAGCFSDASMLGEDTQLLHSWVAGTLQGFLFDICWLPSRLLVHLACWPEQCLAATAIAQNRHVAVVNSHGMKKPVVTLVCEAALSSAFAETPGPYLFSWGVQTHWARCPAAPRVQGNWPLLSLMCLSAQHVSG